MNKHSNEFVEFFYKNRSIPKKRGKFYLIWVNRFLSYYQKGLKPASYKTIKDFQNVLEKEGKEDRQYVFLASKLSIDPREKMTFLKTDFILLILAA